MPERLQKFDPAELDAGQQAIYDVYAERERLAQANPNSPLARLIDQDGHLMGPANVWLLNPSIGQPLLALGAAIRTGPELSRRAQEISILLVAQRLDSAFERFAHEPVARSVGLSTAEIEALSSGAPIAFDDIEEQCAYDLTAAMMDNGALTDAEYERAIAVLGEKGLFDLAAIVGWYLMIGLQLSVFAVTPPSEALATGDT